MATNFINISDDLIYINILKTLFRFIAYKTRKNTQNYIYLIHLYKIESMMIRTYISSNSCTPSDIDFLFDLHCKAQVAKAHMQRNLRSLAWHSLLYISYHQLSNSASLKTFESLVKCITVY